MYQYDLVIRLRHTDAAGIMYFARIFDVAHEAYEAMLDSIGQPIPADLARAAFVIPIVHAEADYRTPLRMGDRVRVDVMVEKVSSRSFTLKHVLSKSHGNVAGEVKTVHVIANSETGKAMHIPDALRAGLQGLGAT